MSASPKKPGNAGEKKTAKSDESLNKAPIEQSISEETIEEKAIKPESEVSNKGKNSKQAQIDLSDEILIYLLRLKKENPSLRFWLRQSESAKSPDINLEDGLWFQGHDYIIVGFWAITDIETNAQTIGFAVDYIQSIPKFRISIVYPDEKRSDRIACYQEINETLSKTFSQQPGPDNLRQVYDYNETNWDDALNVFLNEHKPIIDSIIQKHGLEEDFEIPEEKFQTVLANTLSIRDKLYPDRPLDINGVAEQVKLQTESINVEDKLGRQPFVDSLKTYITKLWSEENTDSYTIHLGGEWGSGKSKVLSMLKNELEGEAKDENWVVVDFNAWQNQHIDPPWWVFMDNVYKGIQKSKKHKCGIWFKERWWRLVALNNLYVISFLILAVLFLVFNYLADFSFFNFSELLDDSTSGGKKLSVVSSYITLIGSFWVLIKGINNSLLPASSNAAKDFKDHVRDPMEVLKNHYGSIIGYTSKNVAVFIDDIDRCNPEFVVKLLEGLQTLFKSKKVLYVIAGDSNWIKKSFEIYYDKLKGVINKPGTSVGNFFLEKTFQMSIGIPQISDETKELFWKYLLLGKEISHEESVLENEINSAESEEEIDKVLAKNHTPEVMVKLRSAAVKRMSEKESILKDTEHKLQEFHKLIEPNARSMKRLINNYALERKAMILAGIGLKEVSDENLIKWIILKSRYPLIADELVNNPNKLIEYVEQNPFSDVDKLAKSLTPQVLEFCTKR